MTAVPPEMIEEEWIYLENLDSDQVEELWDQFFQEQPNLSHFLHEGLQGLEDWGEDMDDSPLVGLAMLAWRTLSKTAGYTLKEVTPEAIIEAEHSVFRQIKAFADGPESAQASESKPVPEPYNQKNLMAFGSELLFLRNKERGLGPDTVSNALNLEILCLQTIVDCLDNCEPGWA